MDWFSRLQSYRDKPMRRVIGLMSGTSLDGIDAACVEITVSAQNGGAQKLQVELQGFVTIAFAAPLREKILALCEVGTIAELAALNVELGEEFAVAVLQLVAQCDLQPGDIDLIGSHGQTISHQPAHGASLQIGEPSVIAERTGITVVADFRPRDLAVGGQGAPLVPLADFLLLRRADRHRIVQNLGGIANCTLLPAACALADVRAWDSGPGNMIMDEAVRILSEGRENFDEDGRRAAAGQVNEAWLVELLQHPFFALAPPKSAGREEWGQHFAHDFVAQGTRRGLKENDVIATATALTAASIAQSYRAHAEPHFTRFSDAPVGDAPVGDAPIEVILGGGGAFNPTLRKMLEKYLSKEGAVYRILLHEDIGLRSDAKEAVAFAILAHATIMGEAGNVPSATGATHRVPLGKIIPGAL